MSDHRPTASELRVEEALSSLRHKDVRSATLERLELTWEADRAVSSLPQPLALGEGLYAVLDAIAVPVSGNDLILGRLRDEAPDAAGEASIREKTRERWLPEWMNDVGHCCFAWDRLLRLGLSGLEDFARREMDRRATAGEPQSRLDFLRGAARIYQAFRAYALRYARAAELAGLTGPAERCRAAAERPPRSFSEALQLVWLVGLVYCAVVTPNPALSFGRMDELLLSYYRADLEMGLLTRDEAGDLIQDLYCKMSLLMGRGEHQMGREVGRGSESDTGWARNLAYDSPLYIVLGGSRKDGAASVNELTLLFIERIVPRLENPVVIFRHTPDVPQSVVRLLCRLMRDNAGIHLFNDQIVIPAMERAGIARADAVGYTMHGCNEPDVPGVQKMVGWSFDRSFWLPRYLLEALCLVGDEPLDVGELHRRFGELLRRDIERTCDAFRSERGTWPRAAPGLLRVDDCFFDGPVAGALSWELGGIPYRTLFLAFGSLATAADSFAAVEELAAKRGGLTASCLAGVLRNDFRGHAELKRMCMAAPKMGQDDDRADRHAVRILEGILEAVDECSRPSSPDGVIAFRGLYTIMGHLAAGEATGATPDGRSAGEPLSENMSPSPGACTRGLTAMLTSLSKLPLNGFATGILNVRVRPELIAGERGLDALSATLLAYFARGGIQLQLTCAGIEELRDARIHPDRHRDLMVRVTGYSAAFTDMTPRAQDEIIRRDEHARHGT